MYGFKVFVTTLMFIILVLLGWAFLKAKDQSSRFVCGMFFTVNVLSLLAIWG